MSSVPTGLSRIAFLPACHAIGELRSTLSSREAILSPLLRSSAVSELPILKYWIIVHYKVPNSDKLIVKQFLTEKVEGLIKQGKLKGEVQTGEPFPHTRFDGQSIEDLLREKGLSLKGVVVTSSAEELRELIAEEGIGAFLGPGKLDTIVFSKGAAH